MADEVIVVDEYPGNRSSPGHNPSTLPSLVGDRVDKTVITKALAPEGYLGPLVHQAEGMLAARRGIGVAEAVVILRTIAHDAGTSLIDAARVVVISSQAVD